MGTTKQMFTAAVGGAIDALGADVGDLIRRMELADDGDTRNRLAVYPAHAEPDAPAAPPRPVTIAVASRWEVGAPWDPDRVTVWDVPRHQ